MKNYDILMFTHLFSILPCVILGALVFILRKGTPMHRKLGGIYMGLMMFTAIVSLFLPARVGPQIFNHFGWIHFLSILTIYTVPTALIAIKKGEIRRHKIKMISLYFGAILIAGGFTLVPGRYLHELLFAS